MAKKGIQTAVAVENSTVMEVGPAPIDPILKTRPTENSPLQLSVISSGTVQLQSSVAVLSLGVPLLTVLREDGTRGYVKRQPDVTFTQAEAETLRDLCDGLRAKGMLNKPNVTEADAMRWLMRKLAEARVQTSAGSN